MTQEEQDFLLNDLILRMPTPKQTVEANLDTMKKRKFSPTTLLIWKKIGGRISGKPLRALWDSGGDTTMLNSRALPKGAEVTVLSNTKQCTTIAGTFNANKTVKCREGMLPEFDRHKQVYGTTMTIFDAPDCPHDIIIGRDMLYDLGVTLNFKHILSNGWIKRYSSSPKLIGNIIRIGQWLLMLEFWMYWTTGTMDPMIFKMHS